MVTEDNAPPVAVDDELTVDQDESGDLNVLDNDTDADDDELRIVAHTDPAHGIAECSDTEDIETGECIYTPGEGFSGEDSFEYTVGDGNGGTDVGRVDVTVEADEPTCFTGTRVLSNGTSDQDGSLAVTVDGIGSSGQAVFNPTGPVGAADTFFSSNLDLGTAGGAPPGRLRHPRVRVGDDARDERRGRAVPGRAHPDGLADCERTVRAHADVRRDEHERGRAGRGLRPPPRRRPELRQRHRRRRRGERRRQLALRVRQRRRSCLAEHVRRHLGALGGTPPARSLDDPAVQLPRHDRCEQRDPGRSRRPGPADGDGDLVADEPYDVTLSQQWNCARSRRRLGDVHHRLELRSGAAPVEVGTRSRSP